MSDASTIAALCKRPLLVLGTTVVASAALLVGMHFASQHLQRESQNTEALVQGLQTQISEQESDLQNVQTHIQRFQQLRAQGLMGDAPRLQWVEQLQQAFQGGSQRLRMELQPAQPLATDVPDADGSSVALSHDLLLEADFVLETEVLHGLEQFRQAAKGRFRVQECRFSDAKPSGMAARCILRFVTISESSPTPTPE